VLNLDFIAFVGLIVVVTAALAWLWRLARGRAETPWWAAVRVAAWSVVALAAVAAASYSVMNARTFQVAGTLVSTVPAATKAVALTFDDGPDAAFVDEVLGDLDRYHAKGTFFVIGAVAQKERAALRRLVAAGEEIGNHSYSHPRLVGVSVERVAAEVEDTDRVIRAAGYGGPILFRPPYCKKLVSAPYYLWRHGRTTVTWDLEPDSEGSLADDPQAMVRYVVANVRPGSIVLLHPWGTSRAASRRALPLIIEALAARGYSFVTASELLTAEKP
jgi:peptidoglycan/xylan/chitin deacetylase (PgdA/CDA1 family)